ncbi:hypothetical protein CLU79DRAFT_758722 [Phycomyces nitens]|nr:hypothetical protein CLU79DRAFT_758722 [Phycomyces nitens]
MPRLENSFVRENLFILSTSVLSLSGWIIAFGSACDLDVYSGLSWWVIVYELLLTSAIVYLSLGGLFMQYRMAVLTFLAVSIPLLSQQINTSLWAPVYYNNSAARANSAGHIIMAIIQFVWVIVFGSEPDSAVSHRLAKLVTKNNSVRQSPSRRIEPAEMTSEKMFRTISSRSMSPAHSSPRSISNTPYSPTSPYLENVASDAVPSMAHGPLEPMEYTERVEALHAYQANRDDPTELSFEKFEVLEIASRAGNWWQARKMDGTVGIIPSNYFAPV